MLKFYKFVNEHPKSIFRAMVCVLALAATAILAVRFLPATLDLDGQRYTLVRSSGGTLPDFTFISDDGSELCAKICLDCMDVLITVDGEQYIAPSAFGIHVELGDGRTDILPFNTESDCSHDLPVVPYSRAQLARLYEAAERLDLRGGILGYGILLLACYCLFCFDALHPDIFAWRERWASRDGELSDEFLAARCAFGIVGATLCAIGAFWLAFAYV